MKKLLKKNKRFIDTKSLMCLVFWGLLSQSTFVFSQKVEKEVTFDPKGKANITNLSEVTIDKENDKFSLFYLTKSTQKKVKAEILHFKLSDLSFINSENLEEDLEKLRTKYKLRFSLEACVESREPLLTLEANLFSGQAVFKKGYIDRYYNWSTGLCDDRFKIEEKVKPKGDDGEKIKLVNYWTKSDIISYRKLKSHNKYSYSGGGYYTVTTTQARTGRVRELVPGNEGDLVFMGLVTTGMKDPEAGMHYVIQKFSAAKLEKISEHKLDFDVASAPLMHKILASGNVAYVFQRSDNFYEFIELDYDGNIQKREKIQNPSDKLWIIDDIVETGDELYISGVVAKQNIKNYVRGIAYNPADYRHSVSIYAYKSVGIQVMKVSNKIDWVKEALLPEIKTKFVAITGEKKGKPYAGGHIVVGDIFVAKNKNVILTGQKKSSKGKMQEVVAFVFSPQGDLNANYSSALRDKNEYNEYKPTRHALMDSPSGNGVYWTVFEVAGAKKRGETARTLYYPRIAKISNDSKSVSQFIDIGERKYFLDDDFPINPIDSSTFLFIGSNRKGKEMWFSKVKFD